MSFWSFPKIPPSNNLSRGAMAILPAMFAVFLLMAAAAPVLLGIFLLPVWLGLGAAGITLVFQRRRFRLMDFVAAVAYCAISCIWFALLFR